MKRAAYHRLHGTFKAGLIAGIRARDRRGSVAENRQTMPYCDRNKESQSDSVPFEISPHWGQRGATLDDGNLSSPASQSSYALSNFLDQKYQAVVSYVALKL